MALIRDIKVSQMPFMANMTELNHLGSRLLIKPDLLMPVYDRIFSSQNYYSDNPLTGSMMSMGNVKEIDTPIWDWQLMGANTRPLVIVENVLPATITQPGKFNQAFQIKTDENWWLPGDVICPGTTNKKFQCRIKDEVIPHGNGYIWNVELYDGSDFMPLQYLEPGTPWVKLFSNYEEGAEQDGSVQFATPLNFSNSLSKYRKQYRITDLAFDQVLATEITDMNGKKHRRWFNYAEVTYWKQWYRELEIAAWYQRSSTNSKGSTGRPVYAGAGIQQQLENSHIIRYNQLTTTLIEEYLQDIFYGRVSPGQDRHVVGYTGEWGMRNFHKAIQSDIDNGGFIKNVEQFTSKVSSPYHTNAQTYGHQYVEYSMVNGAKLTLVHNPVYDDRDLHQELDPATGFPVESQRITFLDFGGGTASKNVSMVKKKNSEFFGYVSGMISPWGRATGTSQFPAHSGEYFSMHVGKMCGVHIEDVTRCGEMIFTAN